MIKEIKIELNEVRITENDVGSLPVQIVLLQKRIDDIKSHLQTNRGDEKSKMAFFRLLKRRKKLLCVLARTNQLLAKKLQ